MQAAQRAPGAAPVAVATKGAIAVDQENVRPAGAADAAEAAAPEAKVKR